MERIPQPIVKGVHLGYLTAGRRRSEYRLGYCGPCGYGFIWSARQDGVAHPCSGCGGALRRCSERKGARHGWRQWTAFVAPASRRRIEVAYA